jgi:hypothetical protein
MKRLMKAAGGLAAALVLTACGQGANGAQDASALANDPTTPAHYVTCGNGALVVDKKGDDAYELVITDAAKVKEFQAAGWLPAGDVQDGVVRKAMKKTRNDYYRYFGSEKVLGETFYEIRWDEHANPPTFAFIELWRVVEGGIYPLTTWDFREGDDGNTAQCTFAETAGNFDLPPPPPPVYEPNREFDAKNCELYVNTLAKEHRHYGGGGYDELFVAAYISVDELNLVHRQGGEILKVGIRMNGKDDVVTRKPLEPAYYYLHQSLWLRGYNNADYDLRFFAFFVDVKRRDGTIDRIWLKDDWQDFQWPSVFDGYPSVRKTWGPNYDDYVQAPSPIYNQKAACAH